MAMHCITCGSALPSETATCPTCGAATPYNVSPPSPSTSSVEPLSSSPPHQEETQPSSDWQEYQATQEQPAPESVGAGFGTSQAANAPLFSQQAQTIIASPAAQLLPVQQKVPRDSSLARPLLFILLALVVILSGVAAYAVFVGRPAEFHVQATAIAQAILTPVSPQDVYTNATGSKPAL